MSVVARQTPYPVGALPVAMTVVTLADVVKFHSPMAYEAFQGPTELIYHDPERAYQG